MGLVRKEIVEMKDVSVLFTRLIRFFPIQALISQFICNIQVWKQKNISIGKKSFSFCEIH